MLKKYLNHSYVQSSILNQKNILTSAQKSKSGNILDIGCDDGAWTLKLSSAAKSKEVWGIEINPIASKESKKRGIKVIEQNLDQPWKVSESFFDLVHGNQVIEHVADVDFLAKEAFRVLKPGGMLIISTENGSSWHNIFAAIMGWQIFSLTNMSSLAYGVGNPLALHRQQKDMVMTNWTHKVIFNYLGLIKFFKLHGFTSVKIQGAGYHPLPPALGKLDVRHAHFLTLTAIK